ncbi:PEP-CTERM sorting domain-containing protein [Massilia dura]|uniref:PEP-CTERM sorting domain-containing protein n=1 Tax=Pseudoduganella dura TaxID=321982 RepID=A0A6I3XDY4_9BURK|nr:FxDxF family PEP-CTERM protein [Pseudoduganella dura]MUI10958.1 PEP-CTERM sorting domain-containing protein [Pseudoduganella dura]
MKLKSIVLAAALLPAFGSAFADDFTVDLIGGPNVWSASLGATHTTGAFSDTFTFSNYSADNGTVFASLINTATTWSDLSFDTVTLNGVNISTGDIGPLSIAAILGQNVTGPLTLAVSGTVTGQVASYGGDFNVTTPVPEPATYGMLAGGLAVLAFAARRRKQ